MPRREASGFAAAVMASGADICVRGRRPLRTNPLQVGRPSSTNIITAPHRPHLFRLCRGVLRMGKKKSGDGIKTPNSGKKAKKAGAPKVDIQRRRPKPQRPRWPLDRPVPLYQRAACRMA